MFLSQLEEIGSSFQEGLTFTKRESAPNVKERFVDTDACG